jgi:hypothetical protein
MSPIYKIHPGIGIARVGKSKSGFFLPPESPGAKPFELDDNGEMPFTGYKDAHFVMRRQAARFRIYEYERNETTKQDTLIREITADQATIQWSIKLASRKAAGVQMLTDKKDAEGARIVTPGTAPRNQPPNGFTADDLVASIDLTATGKRFKLANEPQAKFLRQDFYIGEARTDFHGRLLVLGGYGESNTWNGSSIVEFLNNPGWHDDIADGPVDATVRLSGSDDVKDVLGAWVIIGPPDFAPEISPLTTLYEIAQQATNVPIPQTISFTMDVQPILQRAGELYWVNDQSGWATMYRHLSDPDLSDNSPAKKPMRQKVLQDLQTAQQQMADYRRTQRQNRILQSWADGQFIPGRDDSRPEPDETRQLDQAILSRAIGGGFFPGIEAGLLLREPTIYSDFGRLTRQEFTDYDGQKRKLGPGSLTERMACPWQADFTQCYGNWWPAQRPDLARYAADGSPRKLFWDRNIILDEDHESNESMKSMAENFARLGVIEPITVGGKTVYAEIGRDPDLDRIA